MNNQLRIDCRLLKALKGISYNEIAGYLEISSSSFYNWIRGTYDLGETKQYKLKKILENLKER